MAPVPGVAPAGSLLLIAHGLKPTPVDGHIEHAIGTGERLAVLGMAQDGDRHPSQRSPITGPHLTAQHRHAARLDRPWDNTGLDWVAAAVEEGGRGGEIGDDGTI